MTCEASGYVGSPLSLGGTLAALWALYTGLGVLCSCDTQATWEWGVPGARENHGIKNCSLSPTAVIAERGRLSEEPHDDLGDLLFRMLGEQGALSKGRSP